MLTMDEALQILCEGERSQWLIADWSWHIRGSGNGGVDLGLVRGDIIENCLDDASWTVSKGDGIAGFSTRWEDGEKRTKYSSNEQK